MLLVSSYVNLVSAALLPCQIILYYKYSNKLHTKIGLECLLLNLNKEYNPLRLFLFICLSQSLRKSKNV